MGVILLQYSEIIGRLEGGPTKNPSLFETAVLTYLRSLEEANRLQGEMILSLEADIEDLTV